jgi:hypothetical protein
MKQKERNRRAGIDLSKDKATGKTRRGEESLKMFLLSVLMLFLLFGVCSIFPSFDAQSTSNVVDTSVGNNPSSLPLEAVPPNAAGLGTPNAKATGPYESSTDNAEGIKADITETENLTNTSQPTGASDSFPTNAEGTSQDGNSATEGLFPDGRIFLDGGPPYGYIPTCTPKGPAGIPTIPIDPTD